jgi:hypothetical protein
MKGLIIGISLLLYLARGILIGAFLGGFLGICMSIVGFDFGIWKIFWFVFWAFTWLGAGTGFVNWLCWLGRRERS